MPKKKYEIFMSFKDKDKNGNRTESSRLAEDIFTTLTARGYRVFFSREALPGMVGGEYEPVINAALKTARLLVLVFSNAEEINSEWVKHEWMTFSNNNKPILTVYKGCGDADRENMPYIIRKLQYCDLTEGSERQYEFMLSKIDEIMLRGRILFKARPVRQTIKDSGLSMPTISQQETKPTSPTHSQRKNHNEPNQRGGNRYNYSVFVFPNKRIKVGDKLQFGQYPQGANGEVEPLVWRVLAVKKGRALLITDKLIDAVPYNEKKVDVTWETCTLRKWMNNDFINKAFSNSQEAQIATVTNQNPGFGRKRKKGGNATQDRIFAISFDEAVKYFRDDNDRMAAVTGHTIKQGGFGSDDFSLRNGDKTGWWWLRSPGVFNYSAKIVVDDGDISIYAPEVNSSCICVRPAFWLNLE